MSPAEQLSHEGLYETERSYKPYIKETMFKNCLQLLLYKSKEKTNKRE